MAGRNDEQAAGSKQVAEVRDYPVGAAFSRDFNRDFNKLTS